MIPASTWRRVVLPLPFAPTRASTDADGMFSEQGARQIVERLCTHISETEIVSRSAALGFSSVVLLILAL